MTALKVAGIVVVVYENSQEVARKEITYYEGQPYHLELVTPDGVDWRMDERRVGEAS